jgi:hypothetical protein
VSRSQQRELVCYIKIISSYCVKAVLTPNQFFVHEEINVPPSGAQSKNHQNGLLERDNFTNNSCHLALI